MKNITLLTVILLFSLTCKSQTITWYDTPDGTFPAWGDWSYKDILIPVGMQVDSVYGAFQRPGYATDAEDFIFTFNTGATFDGPNSTSPWDYLSETNSLYGHWIDLTSFNYEGQGVVRIGLPTPAGAIWDSVGIATSSISSASITEVATLNIAVYPNPSSHSIIVRSENLEDVIITDLLGNIVIKANKEQETLAIEVIHLPSGTYFIRQGQTVVKFNKI